jgi:hypothetical protein
MPRKAEFMEQASWLGLLIALGIAVFLAIVARASSLSQSTRRALIGGILLRVVGALGYLALVMWLYGGIGDFNWYHQVGAIYAERIWNADFAMFVNPDEWRSNWWGTQFVFFVTGIAYSLIGPSMVGGFVLFALLGFAGLALCGLAFQRAYPEIPSSHYILWLSLFPSLWLWPSVIGKEPLILLGMGLCFVGYVGKYGRINWLLLTLGLALVYAIRPQVSAVIVGAIVLAQLLSFEKRWTVGRVLQTGAVVGFSIFALQLSLTTLGIETLNLKGVAGYIDETGSTATDVGSSVQGPAATGFAAAPIALFNILFRPLPWEARNPMVFLAGLEVVAMWGLIWYRRRDLKRSLSTLGSDRVKRFALIFILLYAATLGMVIVNLGIIARQRILIFPFLFLLIEAGVRVNPPAKPTAAARWREQTGRRLTSIQDGRVVSRE